MAAVDDLAAAQRALANGQSFSYQGKTYTPKQIRDILVGDRGVLTLAAAEEATKTKQQQKLTKQQQNLQKRADSTTRQAIVGAKEELSQMERQSNFVRQDFQANAITEQQFENHFNRIAQIKTDITLMEAGALQGTLVGSTTGYNRYRTTVAPGQPASAASLTTDAAERVGLQPVGTVQTPTTMANTGATTTTGTTTGGGSGAGGGAAGGRRARRIGDNWINVFKENFPQYSYLLDETVFGADMTELLKRAVTEKWYDSEELATLMEQGFGQTQYAQTTTTNQQNFDKLTAGNKLAQVEAQKTVIRDAYGNLQFTDEQLTQLATKAARDGKQGRALELYIFQEALAKPAGATDYSNQLAATRAITSNRADQIRQIGKDYGVPLSQREIEDVLTGKTSEEDLRQSYKMAARRWYKGIQEDLDAGLTVEQIFKPYRQYAAAILEKPIDQIDLTDQNGGLTVYADALQGEEGPLSLTDWARRLKADPKYGYQYTAQARQEVNNVVGTLEKAFGLTR